MDLTPPEELTMVRDTVREFVQNELDPIERDVLVREKGGMRGAAIPREKHEHLRKLAVEQGLWAMTVPESLGGGGLNALGACLVAEELGKSFVDFNFGDIPPLLFKANAEQRHKFLEPLIAGEIECSLALSEPGADQVRIRAVAMANGWRVTGTKRANAADLYVVFVWVDQGLTCFLVERDRDGVMVREDELVLDNVHLTVSDVLGEIGSALSLGKEYADARRLRAAARQLGITARLLEMSSQYARDWKSLGQPLSVRPAVQRDLADMAVELDAARWLVYRAACEIDLGKPAGEASLRASLFASEVVERSIDRTVQIYGGPAHLPDLPIMRTYGKEEAKKAERILDLRRFQVANSLA